MPGRTVLEEMAVACAAAVRKARGRCIFVGAVAVAIWGKVRASQDIDVLLDIPEERLPIFVDALEHRGFVVSLEDLLDARRDHSHVTIRDPRTLDHWIDAKFVATDDERAQIRAAEKVGPDHLPVSAPEETVAYKLLFGSPRDLEDALGILEVSGDKMDEERLGLWVRRLGVETKYRRLRSRHARQTKSPSVRRE